MTGLGRARVGMWGGIVCMAVLLAGCFMQNVSRDFRFKPDGKTGLVFASVTVSGERPLILFIKYRRVDSKDASEFQQIPVINSLVSMDWDPKGRQLSEEAPAGRLMAIELPPGKYEFYSWHGTIPGYSISSKAFAYQFEAVQGRAVYVGNMHLRIDGMRYQMNVHDRHERDIVLMKQKVPLVPEDQMDTKLMSLAPLSASTSGN
ncbi:MAG TPA: hypothetical protein VF678_08390 [bacterium]